MKMKLLIIRFSSIGDLTQALSLPSFIMAQNPDAQIHFVTRLDLAPLVENNPSIKRIWTLDKNLGFKGLYQLIAKLRAENFTHIYDAHNNLRSFLIRSLIWGPKKLTRPMHRLKRFLLLRFHINLFEKPFSGQRDLIKPLENWGLKYSLPPAPQLFIDKKIKSEAQSMVKSYNLIEYYVLAPSAAYELKRWPVRHFKKLIELNPTKKFIITGNENISKASEVVLDKTGLSIQKFIDPKSITEFLKAEKK